MGTISKSESFWEDSPHHLNHVPAISTMSQNQSSSHNSHLHYERNLNFSTVAVDESEYGFQKRKSARDPLSHRIIEKRRRDRMNNCLADLARLLPQASLRKGRGRIEKTEIVELAIKHLKHLQTHPCPTQGENCEFSPLARQIQKSDSVTSLEAPLDTGLPLKSQDLDHFRLGFQECLKKTMHFLMERKGTVTGDNFYVQLVDCLNRHAELFLIPKNNRSERSPHDQYRQADCHLDMDLESGDEGETHPFNSRRCNDSNVADGAMQENSGRTYCESTRSMISGIVQSSEYDRDERSCSSPEISDAFSYEEKKNTGLVHKPPIPSVIGSHSSSDSSGLMRSSNGRSSDDGSASTSSSRRYKFKSNIKQRFNADLKTTTDSGNNLDWTSSKHHHHPHRVNQTRMGHLSRSNSNPTDDMSISEEGQNGNEVSPVENILENPVPSPGNNCGNLQSDPKKDASEMESSREFQNPKLVPEMPTANLVKVEKDASMDSELDFENVKPPLPGNRDPFNQFSSEEKKTRGVPAFALHETGLFYVPLTIDKEIASQKIGMNFSNSPPPCHPITISVCFFMNPKGTPQVHQSEFELPNRSQQEALNLSKVSPLISQHALGSSSLPSPIENQQYFMNHLFQSEPSVPIPYARDAGYFDYFSNANYPNGRLLPLASLPDTSNNHSHDNQVYSREADILPPFSELDMSKSQLPNQDELENRPRDNLLILSDPCRHYRKRHGIPLSSSSSSLSLGYHSWKEGTLSIPTGSACDEPQNYGGGAPKHETVIDRKHDRIKSRKNGNVLLKRPRKPITSPRRNNGEDPTCRKRIS